MEAIEYVIVKDTKISLTKNRDECYDISLTDVNTGNSTGIGMSREEINALYMLITFLD